MVRTFANKVAEEIRTQLQGVEVEVKEITKNNGQVLTALSIRRTGESIAPTIYMDDFFSRYNNGISFEKVVEEILRVYEQCAPSKDVDMNWFRDYEIVRGRLFAKLVNYESNREQFERDGIVHRIACGDLAVVPMIMVSDSTIGKGTITIRKQHLDLWGVDEDVLFEDVSTGLSMGDYSVRTMKEVLPTGMPDIPQLEEMMVVSSESGTMGAIAILCNTIMNDICERLDCEVLAIIPSSIHEVIICKAIPEAIEFGKIIKEVNTATLDPKEVLSDHPYFWNRLTQSFQSIDDEYLRLRIVKQRLA